MRTLVRKIWTLLKIAAAVAYGAVFCMYVLVDPHYAIAMAVPVTIIVINRVLAACGIRGAERQGWTPTSNDEFAGTVRLDPNYYSFDSDSVISDNWR